MARTVHENESPAVWRKIRRVARVAGREVVEKALLLVHTARDPATPAWVRRTIVGALAYFVWPLDAVPDFLAGFGYTDDLAALAAALATVAAHVTPEIRRRAREQADRLFGAVDSDPRDL